MQKRKKKISTILILALLFQLIIFPTMNLFSNSERAFGQNTTVKINFQPVSTSIPSGYIPDYGEEYKVQNDYTYGWNMDHSDMTVSENVYHIAELDSNIKFHSGGTWEMALNNGSYDVTVSVGDSVYGSNNTINVEGINYWNSTSLNKGEIVQKEKTITVTDGKLTVDSGSSAEGQTRINYIKIVSDNSNIPYVPQNLQAMEDTAQEVTISWDPPPENADVKGYNVYRDNHKIATVTDSVYFTDATILPITTYRYQVSSYDASNVESEKSSVLKITTPDAPLGTGIGLKGQYFNDNNLTNLVISEIDKNIDFNWRRELPVPEFDHTFSVRWTGKVQPLYTEEYTFYTETQGGTRLWVNHQLLIDNWDMQAHDMHPHEFNDDGHNHWEHGNYGQRGTISLEAGKMYDIQLEYKNRNGEDGIKLLWSSQSQARKIVPQSQLNPPFIPSKLENFRVNTTSTTAALTWDSESGATGYDVEVDGKVIDNGSNTQYVVTNLIPDTEHTFRVRAKIPELDGDWTDASIIKTKVAIPLNVIARSVTEPSPSMRVTWGTVTDATYYNLAVDGKILNVGLNTEYTQSGLMPNTRHIYRVRAVNNLGAGDWSSFTTSTYGSDIPNNFNAKTTNSNISLTWDLVSQAIGYDIEVDGTVIDNGLSTTYVHDGLSPNSQHRYRVRIRKSDGSLGEWNGFLVKSTQTQISTGVGLKGQYFKDSDFKQLLSTSIDSNIDFDWRNEHRRIPGIFHHGFSVRWTGQIQPLYSEKYTFYSEKHDAIKLWVNNQLVTTDSENDHSQDHGQSNDHGGHGQDNSGHGYGDEHHDNYQIGTISLQAGKRYDIQVEYKSENEDSRVQLLWSSNSQFKQVVPQVQLYPVGIPQNITTESTDTATTIMWDSVTFTDSYDVEVDGKIIGHVTGSSFTENDLQPGTQHTYRIRAISGIVIGEWSNSVSAVTLLSSPSITSLDATENTISTDWSSVVGATGYEIEVDGTIMDNTDLTNFLDKDLLSGTVHHYRVRAKTLYSTGPWSELKEKWTLPGIPQNVKGIPTSTSINVSWDSVRGATGYDIEANNTIIDNGNNTSYMDSGLNANTQYTYRVRAKNASGVGKWTPIFAKTTLPAPPTNLQGAATDTSVVVNWDPAAGATSYDLEVDDAILQDLTEPTYSQQELTPNSIHSYRVRSKNEDGISNWSNEITVQTLPSVPTNLQTTATDQTITLTWDSVNGSTAYEVEADGTVINNGNSTTYVHNGLDPNSEHSYRVRALNGEVRSYWSDAITKLTQPSIPTNLQGTSTSSEIDLTWDMVVGATGYDIEVDGKIMDVGLNTSYQDKDVLSNSEHIYRVRAKNAGGPGQSSQPITEDTTLGTPQNLVTTATDTSLTLGWDSVNGATGYDIFLDGKIIDNGANQNYVATGLEPFTWHVFRVRAKEDGLVGDWSDAITSPTLLGVPANIKLSAESNMITISWDKVSGATDYEIEVDGKVIDNGLQTTFSHSNLDPNTQHSYRVRSKNEFVTSQWSVVTTQTTAPGVPANLKALATTNSVTLTWDAVNGAIAYDLEADGKVIADIKETQYIQQNLEPNTIHVYRIRAKNGSIVSTWSEKLTTSTTPELKVDPGKDNIFNFVMVVPAKAGVSTRILTATYSPDELEVLDLSANTPETNLRTGQIVGTNLTILEFTAGKIVYQIDNADKTIVNSIKFQAKTNNYSKVTYTVK